MIGFPTPVCVPEDFRVPTNSFNIVWLWVYKKTSNRLLDCLVPLRWWFKAIYSFIPRSKLWHKLSYVGWALSLSTLIPSVLIFICLKEWFPSHWIDPKIISSCFAETNQKSLHKVMNIIHANLMLSFILRRQRLNLVWLSNVLVKS